MLLFYVRHGDPIYDPDSLTELGQKQAEALVARMERCRPDRIFASTSNRAVLTATPTAKRLGLEIEQLDWCNEKHSYREMSVKDREGKRRWWFADDEMRELMASREIRKLDREWYTHPCFAGTAFESGIKRVQRELDAWLLMLGYRHDHEKGGYMAERPNDDRIALFAHQGFGMSFLSCLLDVPYPLMGNHFDISHTGMTVIHFKGEGLVIPKMLQLSNDSHLFAAGMKPLYGNAYEF